MLKLETGNWLYTDEEFGLGRTTFVYLSNDESSNLGDGWFSGWFYQPHYGLPENGWGTFHIEQYPNTRKLTKSEVDDLPDYMTKHADPDYFLKEFQRLAELIKETA